MSGTFAPAPGAAPLLRMVTAQAAMEVRLLLRNGEQLVLALVIPVLVLTGGVAAMNRLDLASSVPAVDLLTPGVLALAVMSTAFTSLAIATGFERQSLRRRSTCRGRSLRPPRTRLRLRPAALPCWWCREI